MRNLKITTIVFLAGTAVCLCAVLALLLTDGNISFFGNGGGGFFGESAEGGSEYTLVLEKEFAPETVRSLKIDYGMTYNDVFFYPAEGDSVIVREYMNFEPKEDQISEAEEKNGILSVKGVKRNSFVFFSFRSRNAYTEIYLPEDLAEELEEMDVKTLSGDIRADLVFAVKESFQGASTSGNICFPEIKADKARSGDADGKISLSSTSGDIVLDRSQGKMTVSTTSGDISLGQATGDADISSTSGNISLGQAEGNVDISTASGDISLGQAEGDIDISTASGDVTLGQTEGNMHVSTTSGDISLEQVTGDIIFSASSGDILLGQVMGDINVSTASGAVSLQEGKGDFEGETTSGDIRIESLDGVFKMSTASGAITVLNGNGHGKAETISGSVKIALNSLTGDFTASTTSGDVDLYFPETVSLRLKFTSSSGECSTFFDDSLRFSKKGNQAEGQYGDGEHLIDVSTVSGDLEIKRNLY